MPNKRFPFLLYLYFIPMFCKQKGVSQNIGQFHIMIRLDCSNSNCGKYVCEMLIVQWVRLKHCQSGYEHSIVFKILFDSNSWNCNQAWGLIFPFVEKIFENVRFSSIHWPLLLFHLFVLIQKFFENHPLLSLWFYVFLDLFEFFIQVLGKSHIELFTILSIKYFGLV